MVESPPVMQATWVNAWSRKIGRKIPHLGQLSPGVTTAESMCPRAHESQLLKSVGSKPKFSKKRSHGNEKPVQHS